MFQIRICLTRAFCAGALASAVLLPAPAAEAGTETVLHSFQGGSDGANPVAGLMNFKGTLYGTTKNGGGYSNGSVFSLNPTTDTEKLVHAFSARGPRPSGYTPAAALIHVGRTLYGTTEYGGNNSCAGSCGTVFALEGRKVTVQYLFQGGSDGANPVASLIDVNGTLYGTTVYAGTCAATFSPGGCGTVFSVNPTTGAETVLHAFQFNGTDGYWPYAGLINVGGTLYGTTNRGGTGICTQGNAIVACGTVFSINLSTGTETVVYSFQNNSKDGTNPVAGLISVGGTLYGTTPGGGANANGTVFSVNPTTGVETVVYSFCPTNCGDGSAPYAGLINVGGALYGTTANGGAGTYGPGGTVFKINPATGAETVVYSFCSQESGQTICTDGESPIAGLINVGGTLYGTASQGGALCNGSPYYGCGTVFKITP